MGLIHAKCPHCWDAIPCACPQQRERDALWQHLQRGHCGLCGKPNDNDESTACIACVQRLDD